MARRVCSLLLAGIICMGAIYAIPSQQAFAHNFSSDESASFVALVHRIQAELQLMQLNVDSNLTLAQNHAGSAANQLDEHTIEEIEERNARLARDLPASLVDLQNSLEASVSASEIEQKITYIDSLLGETVTVRVDSEQLNNATVQAVVLAEIIDDVLVNYGDAFGVDFNMTDMSVMDMDDEGGNMSDHSSMNMGGNEIVNASAYQSAVVYANKSIEIFTSDLKLLALPDSESGESERTAAVDRIEASLVELREAINNEASPADIMTIVHAQIHPNMQVAYNLQIIPEFPLPLLLIIPAIAGIIAITRINALRRQR